MAGTSLTTIIRRRLYSFAKQLARPFSDSRRRTFITDMLTGLIAGGHVHLTAIARGLGGRETLHAAEKRLSRHLGSEHWNMAPVAAELLRCSAENHAAMPGGDDTARRAEARFRDQCCHDGFLVKWRPRRATRPTP